MEEICSCEWCLDRFDDGFGNGNGCREGDGIRSRRSIDGRVLGQREKVRSLRFNRQHRSTSAVFEPIFELLKNPISAVLILIIVGGSFYIVSQAVSSMVGVNEFVYDYGY